MEISNCLCCEKEIKYKPSRKTPIRKYCSNKCQGIHKKNILLDRWMTGYDCGYKKGVVLRKHIRDYLIEKSGYKCEECGWNKINPVTGRSPLEIDHIDGDASNCNKDNLKVLCPNCHSLTDTWKALNKGKANKNRLNYTFQCVMKGKERQI